jgi:hypothetical protein
VSLTSITVTQEGAVQAVQLISRISISALGVVAVAIVAASCDSSRSTDPMAGHNHPTSNAPAMVRYDSDLANQVRNVTARFHSKAQASLAGYEVASPCVSNPPVGGMGFHWVNGPFVDPTFDAMNPEAVLYDTAGNLVAIEYIVINIGQTAPTFGGQPFDVGGAPIAVPHWTLHVWLYEPNSRGLFSPWNPAIVCPSV